MAGLLLFAGLTACAVAAVLWGVLGTFHPQTLQRFTDWYTRADSWSTTRLAPPLRSALSQRLASVLAMAMGGWMLLILIARELRSRAALTAASSAVAEIVPGRHWSELVVGLAVIAFGCYMALKPKLALRMMEANLPTRNLSERATRMALRGGQALGVAMIAFGALLLLLWYGKTH